jgi:hypothetical protein
MIFFLIGIFIGIFVDKYLLTHFPKIEIFIHEFTHVFAAILFFRKIQNFTVTDSAGGFVKYGGGRGGMLGDDIIGLAPYTFPTLMFFMVLFRSFISNIFFPIFSIFIGATLGNHLSLSWRHIKRSWSNQRFSAGGSGEIIKSDIACRGFIYSSIFIISLVLIIYGILLAFFLMGFEGLETWFTKFFQFFNSTLFFIDNLFF